MKVETKDGGDGVRCWNVAAIRSYSTSTNAREEQVAADNPDVEVFPGLLRCYGCEVMEYDYGIRCTAELTLTRYAVRDELAPSPADAAASLNQIPDFLLRAPEAVEKAAETPPAPVQTYAPKKPGLRGLFGR